MKEDSLGKKISTLRKSRAMTQMDLADLMNVTDKAVSKWERDLARPDIDSLPKLAEALGVSLDELMSSHQKPVPLWTKLGEIIRIILKAIPLAMGIAVIVLSILKEIDTTSAILLLGIGMTSLAILLLDQADGS